MFGFLKHLRRKPAKAEVQPVIRVAEPPEPEQHEENSAPVWNYTPARRTVVQQANNRTRGLEVPLGPVLSTLPLELQPRILQPDVGDLTVAVPLEKVLAQLSRGTVKISFGELRQAAPGVFSPEPDRDRVMVDLPLGEILSRLNPALIQRRRVQRPVEVPPEITSPFDLNNGGLIFAAGPTIAKPSTDKSRGGMPAHGAPAAPVSARQTFAPVPGQATPGAVDHAPGPKPPSIPGAPKMKVLPPAPQAAPGNGHLPHNQVPIAPGLAAQSSLKEPNLPSPLTFSPSVHSQASGPVPMHKPIADQAARPKAAGRSAPPEFAPAPAAPAAPPIVVPLTALADGWPESVRREIIELRLTEANLALPAETVEQSLKQGRIVFSWKTLRSWITPATIASVSVNDNTVLELPLKVIAPLFLTRQKELSKGQKKLTVDEEIPNLFFGYPQPESAPASAGPSTKPADTNYYVWDDKSDTVRVHESEVRRGASPGTKFATKFATPNEIVARASALEGVAGALIALPDGLMVASKMPQDYNAETIAGFLPQMFGKVSACTRELRMGELNNLNFTVGNVPWKIFRVNAIFFAAFGRSGEPLPTAQLAGLAAELDHKPK